MEETPNKNWPDVIFAGFELINKIFNKGGIVYVAGFVFIFWVSALLLRLPPEDLSPVIIALVGGFSTKIAMISVIILINIFWTIIYRKMKETMQKEINRLANERSRYIHGEGVQLDSHVSSSDAHNRPAVILPSFEKQEDLKDDK